ncbi:amino acid adenylation domain-containing protein [Saccharopolyspora sp. NFXS83]|uniref:non-ribosomal peptide synthetase n=1 Tax=Saccharopolyspora sp. NFXS83 TaxID=2993560 RepID=UPI00224AC320|nr:non-ribosomal peptide synthetase [Saccharopolyspora sp. NFXS83]MCX2729175.1 amino acid adenylation domain-containing protein [Saccharopolyspora sp. NFXS83]
MTAVLRELLAAVAAGTLSEDVAGPLLRGLVEQDGAPCPQAGARRERTPLLEPDPDPYPLSRGQAALWAIQQNAPGSAGYNLPLGLWLTGRVDLDLLERALAAVVAGRPGLRIQVRAGRDGPQQRITDRGLVVDRLDWAHVTEREFADRVQTRVELPFDLEHDPLHRIAFVTAPGGRRLLLLVFHHLITDGISSHLLLRDIVGCYESLASGGPPPLEPATEYDDFVRWQREMLSGAEAERHREYWSSRLAGCSSAPVLDELVDRPRAAGDPGGHRGELVRLRLDEGEWAAVLGAARAAGLTPFSVVHAAFATLLHRTSGQRDIGVLVPTDGRPGHRFENTIGYLINPVVIRVDCDPGRTGEELFHAVHAAMLDAEEHSTYPFSSVVDDLRRDVDPTTGFGIGFYMQQGVGADQDMAAGQTLFDDAMELTQQGENDLVVEIVVREAGALIYLKYDPDLFDRATAERLAEHYRLVLTALTADPGRSLGSLELATPAERAVVDRANDTATPRPRGVTVADLVLSRAQRTPRRTALVDADKRLTYGELADQVRRCAATLRTRGVRPGDLVGLMLDRRAELVVAMLATHLAGAAYVPLDPNFPAARIELITGDAGLSAVVVDTASADRVPAGAPGVRVLVDEAISRDDGATGGGGNGNGSLSAGPDPDSARPGEVRSAAGASATTGAAGGAGRDVDGEPAYVLYTSGSTGTPKGVEITHGNLLNLLVAMERRPGFGEGDHLLAVTTAGFDISGLELLLPLVAGGSVHIAPADAVKDGVALAELLESSGATVVQATPATWQLVLAAGWRGRIAGKLLCGGEALTRELADVLLGRADEVWNMYGPTETTIWSSASRVRAHGPVTVGAPIANTTFRLLDGAGAEVPFGARGELHIGGQGVAAGYRNRPELTAERFATDGVTGERLFRTGDLGRWESDGSLRLFGRADRQVKLRGYRIELGEVEAAVLWTGLVDDVRVLLDEDTSGHRRLVAFVLATADPGARLRERLAERLPDHMIPARTVLLPEFPKTPNAKVDLLALAELDVDATGSAGSLPAPAAVRAQPDLCERLRRLAAEVAGTALDLVPLDRPLGEAGFDSIRFTRLGSALRDQFGVSVPPTAFYAHPTLHDIAAHLTATFPEVFGAASAAVISEPEPAPRGYEPVAIVGIGGRLPESDSLEEFWSHLEAGRDLVRPYPVGRGFSERLFGANGDGADRFRGAFVRDVDAFDAGLFRISRREAAQMDPQHRLLLHAAHEAMLDAGCAPASMAGSRTGVFVGLSGEDYLSLVGHDPANMGDHFLLGNVASIAANRISYVFDLNGPSATYDTACSSSLVALHRAVRALQSGECDTALAGGANLLLAPYGFAGLRRAGMLSPDGRCKTFDERADGYGRGEGVVLLMLKRLDRAVADGDPVHAVLIGSAENHGGHTHSLTVPNPRAQAEVVAAAHRAAAVPPDSIGYLEAHGTGTPLGDPIEIDGLKDAFSRLYAEWHLPVQGGRTGLGSVKTNIGHLESAAGVAGVVKVVLAMRHRTLPGLVGTLRPNPMLDLIGSPFRLHERTEPWHAGGTPLRAGVSSFGMGGSNVHVVLEAAPREKGTTR